MGRQQHRLRAIGQQVHKAAARANIQGRVGLIQQQQRHLHRQDGRQGGDALLTPAEMMRRPPLQAGQPHRGDRRPRLRLGLFVADSLVQRPKGYILQQRRHEELVVGVLESQPAAGAHVPAGAAAQLAPVHGNAPVEPDPPHHGQQQ